MYLIRRLLRRGSSPATEQTMRALLAATDSLVEAVRAVRERVDGELLELRDGLAEVDHLRAATASRFADRLDDLEHRHSDLVDAYASLERVVASRTEHLA